MPDDRHPFAADRRPSTSRRRIAARLAAAGLVLTGAVATTTVAGQDDDDVSLAAFYGFTGLEVVRIGRDCGPMVVADVDGDGLNDIVIANDRDSRIEIHRQLADPDPDAVRPALRTNEFPDHWRFERQTVSVRHAVGPMVVRDFDGDGRADICYLGRPSEIVFLKQTEDGTFETERRHRRRALTLSRAGLVVANVIGDDADELLAIVEGDIHVHPLDGFDLGTPLVLSTGGDTAAILVEDVTGDGRQDVMALLADDPAPVRVWFGGEEEGASILGAQQRFEGAPLFDAKPVRLPGREAALLATIERPTKRVILHEVSEEDIPTSGDRDAAYGIRSYTDPDGRQRDHAIIDLDGDGRLDLVTTDVEANALAVYRQADGKGLQSGVRHPSLSDLQRVIAANVDDDPQAELFVLSGKEGLVGRCDVTVRPDGGIDVPFPRPLSLSPGKTPIAIALADFADGPRLVVVGQESRDYVVELIAMDGTSTSIDLGKLSRAPETILVVDADQDGSQDLLLLTNNRGPTMIRVDADGDAEVLEPDAMGQQGLVQAASATNTAVRDVDGDGRPELLIADGNFVRAVRYQDDPGAGISPGWQVVLQINATDSGARLTSLAISGDRIIAADDAADALLVMGQDDAGWAQRESLTVRGFDLGPIAAGAFSGDAEPNVLALGGDGFAVVRFAGRRASLREVSSWQPSDERQVPHELATGDVNGDGFVDLVALDAGEQMCDIMAIDGRAHLRYAVGFQVFESRLFTGGSGREYEPSAAIIADVTGDGADDLVMLAHDRILLYPQMTDANRQASRD